MDGIVEGRPPLEATRCIMHMAATIDEGAKTSKVITVNDETRAFLEAPAVRQVCIELRVEDRSHTDIELDTVGRLPMSLYSPRDAATNWQEEVAKEVARWCFKRGRYNPCLNWKINRLSSISTWR